MSSSYLATIAQLRCLPAVAFAFGLDAILGYLDNPYLSNNGQLSEAVATLQTILPPRTATALLHHQHHVDQAAAAYRHSLLPTARIWAQRLERCHRNALILQHKRSARFTAVPYRCMQPLCPLCAPERSLERFFRTSNHLSNVVPDLLRTHPRVRLAHIVFTVRNVPINDLRMAVPALLKAFRQFRRNSKLWTENVLGYVFNTEITWNDTRRTWHPHIHVLAAASFMEQRDLSRAWRSYAIYRGLSASESGSVYIETLKPAPHAAHIAESDGIAAAIAETTKYQVKPMNLESSDEAPFIELMLALRGPNSRRPHRYRMHGSGGCFTIPGTPRGTSDHVMIAGLRALIDDRTSPWWTDEQMRSDSLSSIQCQKALSALIASEIPHIRNLMRAEHT